MLTAVWVAIVVAVAFWAIAVCVGVYVMLRAARLINQSTAVVTGLRQRSEALMDRLGGPSGAQVFGRPRMARVTVEEIESWHDV